MKESIALLITGASGSIYAVRTFEVLKEHYDRHVGDVKNRQVRNGL